MDGSGTDARCAYGFYVYIPTHFSPNSTPFSFYSTCELRSPTTRAGLDVLHPFPLPYRTPSSNISFS